MKTQLLALLTTLVLVGCASEVPIPETHQISGQVKVKAAHHWDVIAGDIASETRKLLDSDSGLKQRTVYVVPAATVTPFNKAFHNFLVTQLVRQGIPVSEKRDNALEVRYETQVVRHESDRTAHRPGTFTALVTGILVARNIHTWAAHEKGLGALAAGVGLDVGLGHLTDVSKTELLVTTSLSDQGLYRMRKSDAYYIEDADGSLYKELDRQAREWKVVG